MQLSKSSKSSNTSIELNDWFNRRLTTTQQNREKDSVGLSENLETSKIEGTPSSSFVTGTGVLIEGFQKSSYSYSGEIWKTSILLSARIVEVDTESVTCECLMDKHQRLYEIRRFPKMLFESIRSLEEGIYCKIKINEKPGSMRIDIYDGTGLNIESDFIIEGIFDSLTGFEMDPMPNK